MFEINVGSLLESYAGDSQTLAFEGPVVPGLYDDLTFEGPLSFSVTLISMEDGIEVIVKDLVCKAVYEGNEYDVSIEQFDRMFKTAFDPLAPDDVGFVNTKNATIDLDKAIREEILISII
jgi:hypothetical protein